jgi:hypothetical protein
VLVVERVEDALCVCSRAGNALESGHETYPALQVHCRFPLTGYDKFLKGARGCRFFLQDAVSFRKSLRVRIGFGANEDPMFRREFPGPATRCSCSDAVVSIVQWVE